MGLCSFARYRRRKQNFNSQSSFRSLDLFQEERAMKRFRFTQNHFIFFLPLMNHLNFSCWSVTHMAVQSTKPDLLSGHLPLEKNCIIFHEIIVLHCIFKTGSEATEGKQWEVSLEEADCEARSWGLEAKLWWWKSQPPEGFGNRELPWPPFPALIYVPLKQNTSLPECCFGFISAE